MMGQFKKKISWAKTSSVKVPWKIRLFAYIRIRTAHGEAMQDDPKG
jgi:hypothetical protein